MNFTTGDIRKVLREGKTVNPRVIEQLVDELEDCNIALAGMTGGRDSLSGQLVGVKEAVSKMSKKAEYVPRLRAMVGVATAAVVGVGSGIGIGFLVWGM